MGISVKFGCCIAFLFLLACPSETTNNALQNKPQNSKLHGEFRRLLTNTDNVCPDGTPVASFRCGCEVLTAAQHRSIQSVSANSAIQCTPICGDDDPSACDEASTTQEDCSQYVCVHNQCGVLGLGGADVDIIRGGCEFNEDAGWYVCSGGFTIDRQTFRTVSNGACAPACGQPQLKCQFSASLGPPIFASPSPDDEEEEETEDSPDIETNCENGADPDGFICSCNQVTAREMRTLGQALLGQDTNCVPYCGDPGELLAGCRRRRCETDVCIGPRRNVMCAAFVPRRFVRAIATFDCNNNAARNTVICRQGNSILEVDQPSFNTISRGVCLSGCGLQRARTQCRFNPVFRRAFLEDTPPPETPPEPAPTPVQTPVTAPASAPASTPEIEPTSQPAPASEPEIEPASQPAPASEPEIEPASEPAPASEPEIEPASEPAPASEPEIEPASEPAPASEPEIEPASEPAPASEPEIEPASEPAPASEPEIEPASEPAPASEPDEEPEEAPGSEPDEEPEEAPGSEPDEEPEEAPGSEPDEEPDEAPASEPVPSSPFDSPASAPAVDVCENIRQMLGLGAITEGMTDDIFDAMFDIPDECLSPGPAPSDIPEPQPEASASAPASEIDGLEEDPIEPPEEEPIEPPEEEPIEPPEEDPIEAPAPSPGEPDTSISPIVINETVSGNTVFVGNWSECSQFCAEVAAQATQERTVLCRSPFGLPLPEDQCREEDFRDFPSSQTCEPESCSDGIFFQLSPFSECSELCASFNPATSMLEFGTQTRTATCSADGSQFTGRRCNRRLPQNVALRRNCNTTPCEIVAFETSRWARCSCTTLRQTRTVTCRNQATGEAVDDIRCEVLGASKPRDSRPCTRRDCPTPGRKLLQTPPSQSCDGVTCSGRGTCDAGDCTCENEDFDGLDCQFDMREETDCPRPSILDPEGECCLSGVFNLLNYTCCEGDNSEVQLDKDGACCNGPLDMCGVCNGTGVLDALGSCCEGTLDASGLCCNSGAVDECGICDGDGGSCRTEFVVRSEVSVSDIRRRCNSTFSDFVEERLNLTDGQDFNLDRIDEIEGTNLTRAVFSASGLSQSANALERQFVSLLRAFRRQNPRCDFRSLNVAKAPDCGNDICEIGEAIAGSGAENSRSCEADCEASFTFCRLTAGFRSRSLLACSGHGRCLYGDRGQCECFEGYTGNECDRCAPGFYSGDSMDSRCFPRQNFIALRDAAEEVTLPEESPTESPSPDMPQSEVDSRDRFANVANSGSDDDNSDTLLIVLLPVFAILACLFVVIVFYLARKRSRSAGENPDEQQAAKKLDQQPSGKFAPAKTESSLWALFSNMLAPTARPGTRQQPTPQGQSLHDSPTSKKMHLVPDRTQTPTEDEKTPFNIADRGLSIEDPESPKPLIAIPADINPNTAEKNKGIMNVRRWDTGRRSMKGSSDESSLSLLEPDSERVIGTRYPGGGPSRLAQEPTPEEPAVSAGDEAPDERETQTASTQIHGVPSEQRSMPPQTAGSRSSANSVDS